jgi:protein phosphatase 1 regulatory subunit 10
MRCLDPKGKKRKLVDPVPGKPSQPLKKAALGTAVSTKPTVGVKKEPGLTSITTSKTPSQAVKDAKADSSFFSAPKPKAKLPSFKKASVPVQVKKEESNNIAVPSSYDPFQEVLKSMKTRKDSPAVSTPPATSTPNLLPDSQQGLARNVRKKKSVTWAPDHQLESIKLIEKAIYDDDPVDVSIFLRFVAYCTLIITPFSHFVLYLRFYYSGYTYGTQLARFGSRRGCRITRSRLRRGHGLGRTTA